MTGLTQFDEVHVGDWLTKSQAAIRLGCSSATIANLIRNRQLRAVRTQLGVLIDPSDLSRVIAERGRGRLASGNMA